MIWDMDYLDRIGEMKPKLAELLFWVREKEPKCLLRK